MPAEGWLLGRRCLPAMISIDTRQKINEISRPSRRQSNSKNYSQRQHNDNFLFLHLLPESSEACQLSMQTQQTELSTHCNKFTLPVTFFCA